MSPQDKGKQQQSFVRNRLQDSLCLPAGYDDFSLTAYATFRRSALKP